jgi:hypothetical protein
VNVRSIEIASRQSTAGDELRKYLEEQLNLIERAEPSKALLLRKAVEGLIALNYGESQPMFLLGDKKGSKDGTKPYTLRKLRMEALGYADLLIANGYKGKAIRTVASAYGQKIYAFKGWRKSKRLGKTTDPLMKSFREAISKLDWIEDHVLAQLTEAGKKYLQEQKLAHKSKK